MNVLFINDVDLPGARFNGHDMQVHLNRHNIPAKQIVLEKTGTDPNTIPMVRDRTRCIESHMREWERRVGINAVAGVYGRVLMEKPEFIDADIVHYHLLHNCQISILDLPELMSRRPSIWSLHDPWALTGHCVHPIECDLWKSGCPVCPHLDRYFPLEIDNASSMWAIKRSVYAQLDVDIVVASQWMLNMVRESPLTSHFERVHVIPFGIDTTMFAPRENKRGLRIKHGIPRDSYVVFFRAETNEFKGLGHILDMLDILQPYKNVALLTVGQVGLLGRCGSKYPIYEKGWVGDPSQMGELFAISDVFLMPSIAEAFGLMAIEAMASGLPVIVLEGTALPSVTFAPECGIELKRGDARQFADTVQRLMQNSGESVHRGQLGVELARKHYDFQDCSSRMIALYRDVYRRRKGRNAGAEGRTAGVGRRLPTQR